MSRYLIREKNLKLVDGYYMQKAVAKEVMTSWAEYYPAAQFELWEIPSDHTEYIPDAMCMNQNRDRLAMLHKASKAKH